MPLYTCMVYVMDGFVYHIFGLVLSYSIWALKYLYDIQVSLSKIFCVNRAMYHITLLTFVCFHFAGNNTIEATVSISFKFLLEFRDLNNALTINFLNKMGPWLCNIFVHRYIIQYINIYKQFCSHNMTFFYS